VSLVTDSDNLTIVGGSLGGLHTAEALRAQGYTGRITVVDAHPEPRHDRPPMSKEYLAGNKDTADIALRTADRLAALDVDWRLGVAAVGLNVAAHYVQLGDGTSVAYSALVIATGVTSALPTALCVPGAMTLRTREDADLLRERLAPDTQLVVIGAGFIGLEVAATFRTAGADVHIVEAAPTPLNQHLGAEVGRAVQRLHESRGVIFHVDRQAVAVDATDGGTRIELGDGSALVADVLLVAVGSLPAVGWLDGCGVTLDDGVLCDPYLVAAHDIYAIGDVARWPHPSARRAVRIEHWTNAVEQATYIAEAIVHPELEHKPFGTIPYFWSDHYGARIQAHGFPDAHDDIEVVDGDLESEKFAVSYRSDGRPTAIVGLSTPRQVLAAQRQLVAEFAMQEATT
jgi:NADPH-dependent 2,4-dienoyl-CoA reductase/sulfur reductase-like enzyme